MVFNEYLFGLPAAARFYHATPEEGSGGGEGDGGGNAGALDDFSPPDSTAIERARNQERVEGENPPDFSFLGKEKPPVTPPEAPAGGEPAPAKEKPAGGQPAKPATPPKKEPKAPEPPKKAETPPAKPAEPKKEAPKPGEKPPEAAAKKDDADKSKFPTDEEIDKLQPKPGMSRETITHISQMRDKLKTVSAAGREAATRAEAMEKELATLKESSGKLPPDVEQRLKAADQFQLLFDAQNSPDFRKEYDGKIEEATGAIFKILEAHKLPTKFIDEIKTAAAANGGNIEAWPHWAALLNKFNDPLAKQEAINALTTRRGAIKARADKLNSLATDREGYVKEMETRENSRRQQWAKDLAAEAMRIGAAFEPAIEKEVPEGASAEVKAAIEAHNARVSEIAQAFQAKSIAAWKQDPKVIAQLAFDGVRAEEFERQLTEAQADRDQWKARAEAAEGKIGRAKEAGRLAHIETPAGGDTGGGRKTTVEEGKVGGDGSSALRNFFANR